MIDHFYYQNTIILVVVPNRCCKNVTHFILPWQISNLAVTKFCDVYISCDLKVIRYKVIRYKLIFSILIKLVVGLVA
jgi:hypothetical protein